MAKKNNYALISMADNNTTIPIYVLLKSFLEHNKWFKGDIVIIQVDEFDAEATEALNSLYNKIVYYRPDHGPYLKAKKQFDDGNKALLNRYTLYWPHMLKFEAFGMEQYDRVVFLDADMMVVGGIKDAFFNDYEFCLSSDDISIFSLDEPKQWKGDTYFNSGFFSVKEPKKVWRDMLITLITNYEIKEENLGTGIPWYTGACPEQDSINRLVKGRNVMDYGTKYNALQWYYQDTFKRKLTKEKIVHYFGIQKPWRCIWKDYSYIHGLWYSIAESSGLIELREPEK